MHQAGPQPVKRATVGALEAEEHLRATLARIGSDDVHYVRCFRTGRGRQLALNRVNAGLNVWTEPVWEDAPASFRSMRKKRYAPSESRISSLEANAPRLYKGYAADYWRFPSFGALEAFVEWYKTL
jgi:hypothetical protein